MTLLPSPVIIGVSSVPNPVLGGATDGRASTDTDVNRSSRHGNALVR